MTHGHSSTKNVHFLIVRELSPYNVIFGRVAMQQFGAVVSTIHGAMKFRTTKGIRTIASQQLPTADVGQILQGAAITNNEREKDDKNTEPLVINKLFPAQPVHIGRNLPTQLKNDRTASGQQPGRIRVATFRYDGSTTKYSRTRTKRKIRSEADTTEKRGQSGERNRAINIEVDKLVQA